MPAKDSKEGFWVSLEGFDAVGKTTQLPLVIEELRKIKKNFPIVESKEFSDSPSGKIITKIIEEKRFFALNDRKTSPLADSGFLLTDLLCKLETEIIPTVRQGGIAVSDRGPLSIVGYQSPTIAEQSLLFDEETAIVWSKTLVQACPIIPDLTILLYLNEKELQRRIVQRGENLLDQEGLTFLKNVYSIMLHSIEDLSKEHIILDGDGSIENITAKILAAITSKIK